MEKRFQWLHEAFSNSILELCLLSYQSALSCFSAFNLFLQREKPLIYLFRVLQQRFMQKLPSRFIYRPL